MVRNERAQATRMRVDNHWERKTYNRIYLRKPHREKVYQCVAQAKYPHKRHDARRKKVRPGNWQSSRHNIQAWFWSTSANHRRKNPSRSLEYLSRTLSTNQSDEHLIDYLRIYKQKTVRFQKFAQIHKPLPSCFWPSLWLPDWYLLLHLSKHQNVLRSHYSDVSQNRLLCSSISNPKEQED